MNDKFLKIFKMSDVREDWCIVCSHPSLPPYAENHWELRSKIVCEGYDKFIDKLEWPNDPKVGSKIAWKGKMMNPNTWGDEVVLQLASNLIEVENYVITAFNGVTFIKSIVVSPKQPIYLLLLSKNDFESLFLHWNQL